MNISVDELLHLLSASKEKTYSIADSPDEPESTSGVHCSNIGENTKKIRMKSGLSQEELARKVGVGRSMLAQIERGTKTLSLPLAIELADALKCSVYDFVTGKGA